MSQDTVPFSRNERYASDDLNELQRLAARLPQDVAAAPIEPVLLTTGSASTAPVPVVSAVLSGLEVAPSGADLVIAPGLVAYQPAPAEDPDGPVRGIYLAENQKPVNYTLPASGSDTWLLVSGTPTLVDDPEAIRGVWSDSARKFEDTLVVKRKRSALTLSHQAGTPPNLPATAGAVPLYGVFRPAAGGTIDPTQIVDLRPFPVERRIRNTSAVELVQNQWRTDAVMYYASTKLRLNAHVRLDGQDLHAVTLADVDPLTFKSPADPAPADLEWWYLYLAPWILDVGGRYVFTHPRHAYANVAHQGLLIFTKTPPFAGDATAGPPRTNSASITPPAPFSAAPVPSGFAACIAQLKRRGASSSWYGARGEGAGVELYAPITDAPPSMTNGYGLQHDGLGLATNRSWAPAGAREIDLRIAPYNNTNQDAFRFAVVSQIPGGATEFYYPTHTVNPLFTSIAEYETRERHDHLPVLHNGAKFSILLGSTTSASLGFRVVGAGYRV